MAGTNVWWFAMADNYFSPHFKTKNELLSFIDNPSEESKISYETFLQARGYRICNSTTGWDSKIYIPRRYR